MRESLGSRAHVQPVAALITAITLLLSVGGAADARPSYQTSARHPAVVKPTSHGPSYVAGQVLIRFKRGKAPARADQAGASSIESSGAPGWKLIRLKSNETVDQAVKRFRTDPRVLDVTPNHIYHGFAVPNDPGFDQQWGLDNTGQTVPNALPPPNNVAGTAGDDIAALNAWSTTTWTNTVKVAVVDSGVAVDHPDLAPNMDLVDGKNFATGPTTPSYYDRYGHGTHVAGIIGAVADDGFGVAGVGRAVSMMPVRVLDSHGNGSTTWVASGFSWAASHGAKVINASFGGGYDPALLSTMQGLPDVLFVVAAGNNGTNNDVNGQATYPCNFNLANIICVAASDQNDQRGGFSNYGPISVDLAAPGTNILSTYLARAAGFGGLGNALTDSPSGGYGNNADTWAEISPDLTGKTSCSLQYEVRGFLASGDTLAAEESTDGTTWSPLGSGFGVGNYNYTLKSHALTADGQPVHLRLRLQSDSSGTEDGVYIDNVAVVCNSITVFSDDFESGLSNWAFDPQSQWGTTAKFWDWVYDSGTSMSTPMVSGVASLIWSYQPSATVAHVKAAILKSVDQRAAFAGITVTGGRLNAERALTYSNDYSAPTGVAITGAAFNVPIQRSRTFTVGWTASDSGTGVQSYDVEYKRAFYNGSFGSWTKWKSGISSSSAVFAAAPGYTYCFLVRARDKIGNLSNWSPNRCTAVPVNDTTLTASVGWTRRSSSSTYMGTYTYGTKKFTTLTLSNVSFKHLAILVTACNGCGIVEVLAGSANYGWFGASATSTQYTKLIMVKALSVGVTPRTITIVIESSGAPVNIEALGISRL